MGEEMTDIWEGSEHTSIDSNYEIVSESLPMSYQVPKGYRVYCRGQWHKAGEAIELTTEPVTLHLGGL